MQEDPMTGGPLRAADSAVTPARASRSVLGRTRSWVPQGVLVIFFLNVCLRGDGYFPFSKTVEPHLFGFVVLLQTVVLIAASVWMAVVILRPRSLLGRIGMSDRVQLALAVVSLVLIAALQILNARRFAEFGYVGRPVLLAVLLLGASLALALLWGRNRFWGVLLADLILKVYPLVCFPIAAKRSDMLPIIGEAARSMLAGENIYRFYLLDSGVWTQMVRFPGLVMAYASATMLNFDPRLITLASEALFFVLLFRRFRRNPLFSTGVILLALSPYWHFRHELYEAPFWVALAVVLLALERRDSVAEVAALSIVVCMHQWGLLFLPFIVLFVMRSRSRLHAIAMATSALGVGALVVGVASRGDLPSFWQHTVAYYGATLTSWAQHDAFPRTSLYLTPWIARAGGATAVKIASALLVAAVFGWACVRLRDLAQLVGFFGLALLAVLLTNTVAWTYQYLLVGALLWIGLMLRTEADGDVAGETRQAR